MHALDHTRPGQILYIGIMHALANARPGQMLSIGIMQALDSARPGHFLLFSQCTPWTDPVFDFLVNTRPGQIQFLDFLVNARPGQIKSWTF